jgi:hypothetical protein
VFAIGFTQVDHLFAILGLLLCLIASRTEELPVIKDSEAVQYLGKNIEVCGSMKCTTQAQERMAVQGEGQCDLPPFRQRHYRFLKAEFKNVAEQKSVHFRPGRERGADGKRLTSQGLRP